MMSTVSDAALHPAVKYTRVVGQTLADMVYRTRHCLAKAGPVVIGVQVYQSFEDTPSGNVPMPEVAEELLGGHAILLVGYDDKTQRFTFRNSWGTSWGDAGYGTLPYAYVGDSNLTSDCWSILLVK